MKWLLWREYRLNRLILITGAFLLLLPYVIILITIWRASSGARSVGEGFGIAAIYSLMLSQLTMALLGGNAISGERADRSAEFIAYLPLPRLRLLGVKLSLAFSAVALIWGTNLVVLWILGEIALGAPTELFTYVAIVGWVFYSVSWLISSFQSSPTFAVIGGLMTPLIVFMSLQAVAWSMNMNAQQTNQLVENGCATIFLILAVACFSIGTWYYLRCVEP